MSNKQVPKKSSSLYWRFSSIIISALVVFGGVVVYFSITNNDYILKILIGVISVGGLIGIVAQVGHSVQAPSPKRGDLISFFCIIIMTSLLTCSGVWVSLHKDEVYVRVGSLAFGGISPSSPNAGESPTPVPLPKKKVLRPGEYMAPGDKLYSNNEQYYLEMDAVGRLAVYTVATGEIRWTNNEDAYPRPDAAELRLTNQDGDGNMVIRTRGNNALWSTNTGKDPTHPGGHPGATFEVLDDGSLVVKNQQGDIIWMDGERIGP